MCCSCSCAYTFMGFDLTVFQFVNALYNLEVQHTKLVEYVTGTELL